MFRGSSAAQEIFLLMPFSVTKSATRLTKLHIILNCIKFLGGTYNCIIDKRMEVLLEGLHMMLTIDYVPVELVGKNVRPMKKKKTEWNLQSGLQGINDEI
uniref:Uncharacterized protein n=1 Tax=Lactuca sativa TaxID=4236 RepID=A0A9R1WED0_LACSA|nr:hypothetical protein LSAT_V11C200054760 [Lactuca sativa]